MMEFFSGQFIVAAAFAVSGAGIAFAEFFYLLRAHLEGRAVRYMRVLIFGMIGAHIFFAAGKSVLQYFVWTHNRVGVFLLPPHRSASYFLWYSGTRFWLYAALSIAAAVALLAFLRVIARLFPGGFERGETEFIFVAALAVGFPQALALVALSCSIALAIAAGRAVARSRGPICFGDAFALAVPVVFVFGSRLIALLHLSGLRV